MKDNIMHAFGKTPDIFKQRVELTLLRLEERPMKKTISKSVLITVAALITLLGIAAAAGSTYLFEVFGKQPLDGAEEGIVNITAEPVVINDDITAVIDRTYYDGTSIYYEITITLAEPDKFRIFCEDQNLSLKHYTPTGEFTALDVVSTLFDRFEITGEFGEEYEPTSASADQYIEHVDGGVYKLYGSYRYNNDNGFALPDELELDISLDIRYDPTEDDFDLIKPVEAVLPFSIKKSAESIPYDLTPVSQPDGWTITSADCEHSLVSDKFTFYYNFGGRFDEIWNTTFDVNSSIADIQYADELLHNNLYKFFVLDPDTGKPMETFSIGGDIENCEFFTAYVEVPAFRDVPESISVQVIQKKLTDWRFGRYDGDDGMICYTEYEEVDLGVIEFQLSPGKVESELSTDE